MAKTKTRTRQRTRQTKAARQPLQSKVLSFLREIVVVLGLVLVIQTFAFASFYVPTPSMEANILVGDRIFVSKLHYGPRLPTTIGIPYTRLHIPGLEFPAVRLPGFSEVGRGDVVVFNFPPDDLPISKKEHYVKRAVGLPGDKIEVKDKQVFINDTEYAFHDGIQEHWLITLNDGAQAPWARFRSSGAVVQPFAGGEKLLLQDATRTTAEAVRAWPETASVEPFVLPGSSVDPTLFPGTEHFNMHQFGPIHIPKEGEEIMLNRETWPVYEVLITRYEGHEARLLEDGRVEIDGEATDRYRVEQDYYFMMGDNRDNSLDSRAWGFVPADHIVGKAVVAYFSWDTERNVPRLNRTGMRIR